MAMLPGSFNSEEHDDMDSYDIIPEGEYVAMIDESTIKPTKKALEEAGNNADLPLENYSGLRLNLRFKIMGGDYDGKYIFNGLNIKNPNPVAVEISQKELATICRAVGKVSIQDSAELHNTPMSIKVKVKPATAQYEAQNAIKSYEPFKGGSIPPATNKVAGAGVGGAASPNKPSGGQKRAWEE